MPRIDEMFAFVTSDTEPDDEGVIGMYQGGAWMPFVGADMARADQLKVPARAIALTHGKEVRLLHFSGPPEVVARFGETEALTWTCHVCHRERPDHLIAVYKTDLSVERGLPPGSIFQNVRYCTDTPSCVERAKDIRFFT